MTEGIPGVPESGLDPVLLQPVRLFVACLLADARWYEQTEIRDLLGVPGPDLDLHIQLLRASGHLQARPDKLQLTRLGLDRLTAHVVALQTVAGTAADLVAGRRDGWKRDSLPTAPRPHPALPESRS
ncbi:hypothetical protein GCM10027258_39700 [Amycolatopsis stemonae]